MLVDRVQAMPPDSVATEPADGESQYFASKQGVTELFKRLATPADSVPDEVSGHPSLAASGPQHATPGKGV